MVLELGHANLFVSDLDRSVNFYGAILRFPEVARAVLNGRRVAFFSLGVRHHDLALVEVGRGCGRCDEPRPGLNHVGLKIGDSIGDLRRAREHLLSRGIKPLGYRDHRVCKSIHVQDPDGIGIELYADANPTVWANNPSALAFSEPFDFG